MGIVRRDATGSGITVTVHPNAAEQQAEELARQMAAQDYADLSGEAEQRLGYQVEYSQTLLQGLTIANGGALVALFTLVGAVQESSVVAFSSGKLWMSFIAFSIGLVTNLVATVGGFLSQMFYYNATKKQGWNAQSRALGVERNDAITGDVSRGNWSMALGFVGALGSLTAFVFGCGFALSAVIV